MARKTSLDPRTSDPTQFAGVKRKTCKVVRKNAKKMKGTFCERTVTPAKKLDKRSLRWKQSGKSWVLVGCPKGKWSSKAKTCKVGTKAHKVLARKR